MAGPEPIAVIGMSCRFSGASSIESFWEMISNGRTGHGSVPSNRYQADAWYHPSHERKGAINHTSGFFLEGDPSHFDAPFFSITAKEAAGMDPAQRLLLEVAYEAFENAGVPMDKLPSSHTAVYSGCMTNDYELLSTRDMYDMPHNAASGNGRTMLANRISWFFDLRGPSVMLDTACSSSLTALHLAVQALRSGDCNSALITGASLILHPNFTQRLNYMHMLSADGISHSFDSRANGYGRGEGIGAVLVKPLRQAMAEGDCIRAVIRATGANQDGRTPGITMPSAISQADLMRSVYEGLAPMEETTYFEAHGTGTPVGDPTELSAIGETLGKAHSGDHPVYVGSVKSNVGHTEGAAGVASLIKTVLCLERGEMVPTAGLETANPRIRLDDWRLRLCREHIPWPANRPQRASINSFGFGGSNAHAVLESARQYIDSESPGSQPTKRPQILVFSTYDSAGLDRISDKWHGFLSSRESEAPVRDIAYTLAARRSQLAFRSFAVAESLGQLDSELVAGLPKFERAGRTANLMFVFTGQGAQWAGMGKELLQIPAFQQSVARSQAVLAEAGCPWDVVEEIEAQASQSRINQPDRSQPICTVLQIALVDLLASWGVHPRGTVGHSSGEIGAAYAAGYLSQEDAARIAYFRGVLCSQVKRPGSMLAVGLGAEDARKYLTNGRVVVACMNSPTSTTLSGDTAEIDRITERLKEDGHFARKLRVETAYHSPHMQDIAEAYAKALEKSNLQPENRNHDRVAMLSSVTTQQVHATDLTAEYWVKNLLSPVDFTTAVSRLANLPEGRRRAVRWSGLVEVGPHEALKGPTTQTLQIARANIANLHYAGPVRRSQDALTTALQLAGSLWSTGYPINLTAVNASVYDKNEKPNMEVDLPSYPWNHQTSFWHEPKESAALRGRKQPRHDLLGVRQDDGLDEFDYQWRHFLRVSESPWIADHVVAGAIVFPAAGMASMVVEAARQLVSSTEMRGIEFHDLRFMRGLVVPGDDRGVETRLQVRPHAGLPGWFEFWLFTRESTSWIQHATGAFTVVKDKEAVQDAEWQRTATRIRATQVAAEPYDIAEVYRWLSEVGGVTLGPAFQDVLGNAGFCAPARLCLAGKIPDTRKSMPHEVESDHLVHPTSLDAMFQAAVLSCSRALSSQMANIPVAVERLFLSSDIRPKAGEPVVIHAETQWEDEESLSDCFASSPDLSDPHWVLQGVRLGRVPVSKFSSSIGSSHKYSSVIWGPHLDTLRAEDGNSDDGLGGWVRQLCHTHGDATCHVVANSLSEAWFTGLQNYAPESKSRPRLRKLTVEWTSEELDAEKASLQQDLPGAQVISPSSLEELVNTASDLLIVDIAALTGSYSIHENSICNTLGSAVLPGGLLACVNSASTLDAGHDFELISRKADITLMRRKPSPIGFPAEIYLLTEQPGLVSQGLQRHMGQHVEQFGCTLSLIGLDDEVDLTGKTVISLLEFQQPWVARMSATSMERLQRWILRARYLLWVARSPDNGFSSTVDLAATTGLLRTLRNEQSQLTLAHLQFDWTDPTNSHGLARGIVDVLTLTLRDDPRRLDGEFRLQNGQLLVPRFIDIGSVDQAMKTELHGPQPVMAQLVSDDAPGPLHLPLSSQEDAPWELEDPVRAIEPAGIEVDVQMVSISDGTQHQRCTPEASSSAIEVVGTVKNVGSNTDNLARGDQVVFMTTSTSLSTLLRVPSSKVRKLAQPVDLARAVSSGISYTIAYHALFNTLHLDLSSSLLIVGPPSRTVRALLACALSTGLQVYLAMEESRERESIAAQYPGLRDHIFDVSENMISSTRRMTAGKGVQGAITALGGPAARTAARCLAPGGHLLHVGGDVKLSALPDSMIDRGCTFSSLRLQRLLKDTPESATAVFQHAWDLASRHNLLPSVPPFRVFPVSEVSQARQHSRQTGTRVLLDFRAPGLVPILPRMPDPASLNAAHTYILAGGLGVLGLALAETLVELGARHLVFLSRSGAHQEAQSRALQALNDRGCNTDVVQCDISNEGDIQRLLLRAWDEHWQIKGVIQGTTVLRDAMFDQMTFQEWTQSTESKIRGTLNIHHLLPQNGLEFFINLSSVASIIGNIGQANYAAGNAVMDALARWRRSHGLPGHSINIGLVPDGGDGSESPAERAQRYGHLRGTEITVGELQALLRVILRDPSPVPPQLSAGLNDQLSGQISWHLEGKFTHRLQLSAGEEASAKARLREVKSIDEASALVKDGLREYLATAMAAAADSIDPDQPLSALGVDSLKATEVQNWVSREMGAELSSFDFLGSLPLKAVADKIASNSSLVVV